MKMRNKRNLIEQKSTIYLELEGAAGSRKRNSNATALPVVVEANCYWYQATLEGTTPNLCSSFEPFNQSISKLVLPPPLHLH